MERVDGFLQEILQGSFLSTRDKSDCFEEMKAHLQISVEHLERQGYGKEEAIDLALKKFGEPIELRRSLTKSVFGLSHRTILSMSALFAGLFLCSFLFLTFRGVIPVRHPLLSPWTLLSPAIWLTFLIGSLSFFKTRKRVDRIMLALVALPFLAEYAYLRLLFPSPNLQLSMMFTGFYSWWLWLAPDYMAFFLLGLFILFAFSLGVFFVTRNRFLAYLPVVLSIGYSVWPMIRIACRVGYLRAIHSSGILYYPLRFVLSNDLEICATIGLHLVLLLLLIAATHFLQGKTLGQLTRREA